MLTQVVVVLIILGVGMYWSVKANQLTEAAAVTGGFLGLAIFLGAGFTGLAMLGSFFILGSVASTWKLNYKIKLGLAEENKGRRKASQALANGGVAGILGLLSWWFPTQSELFIIMLAGSFAAATSDTLSSELGNIYGKRYYNILTFKPDTRGLNGVISLEGILFGVLGSCFIGLLYGLGYNFSLAILAIITGGIIGNLADSVLGATLERKLYLTNDAVNFINTFVGALTAGLLYAFI